MIAVTPIVPSGHAPSIAYLKFVSDEIEDALKQRKLWRRTRQQLRKGAQVRLDQDGDAVVVRVGTVAVTSISQDALDQAAGEPCLTGANQPKESHG